jgi:serralysin
MATVSQVTSRPVSGNDNIDALIGDSQPWNYLGRNVLYYTFSLNGGTESSSGSVNLGTLAGFNETQKAATRAALNYVTQVTGIVFAETGSGASADIHFANADIYGGTTTGLASNAWNYSYSGNQVTNLTVDSWVYLDNREFLSWNQSPTPGTYGYETLLHEIGHALGLKHPFEGSDVLPAHLDNTAQTLMSYTDAGGVHSTYSPLDLAALNWLYGGDGLGGAYGAQTGASAPTASAGPAAATAGNDRLVATASNDSFNGGAGIDTVVFSGVRAGYTVTRTGNGYTVSGEGTDTLTGVERLQFADRKVAIDVDGHAGQAYRLYQAAFDRAPDVGGLGYQMDQLDKGLPLRNEAQHFIESPEFQARYGAVDNAQFVTLLYNNVLDRAPEAQGLAYHLDRLAHGVQRADILVGFSESPENQALVIGAIQNGMDYA